MDRLFMPTSWSAMLAAPFPFGNFSTFRTSDMGCLHNYTIECTFLPRLFFDPHQTKDMAFRQPNKRRKSNDLNADEALDRHCLPNIGEIIATGLAATTSQRRAQLAKAKTA